jgi:pSer/pThr/pTyr-binding forkhead associated (FHA) protein
MPKLIVSIDGVVVKEVQLTKDRSTIGRRPYNDIVIDNLAVSGEHAVIQMADGETVIEDLGSTNGTYVNGNPIRRHTLAHDDTIDVGRYKLKFIDIDAVSTPAALSGAAAASVPAGMESGLDRAALGQVPQGPRIRVLSGAAAGREMALTKPVTTIGKPNLCVASITRGVHGYELAQLEGERVACVNGVPVDAGPITLKNRDQIDLGGIRLEFADR